LINLKVGSGLQDTNSYWYNIKNSNQPSVLGCFWEWKIWTTNNSLNLFLLFYFIFYLIILFYFL